MPSATAGATLPLEDAQRRAHLLERFAQLRSGREKAGRFWRIDLESIAFEPQDAAAYAAPGIESPAIRGGFAVDIRSGASQHAELFARAFGQAADAENEKFAALATALCNTGAFIYIPADVAVDEPIVVTYTAGAQGLFPYTLVLAERGAQVTVIERTEGEGFICGVSEIVTGENAHVTFAAEQVAGESSRVFFTRACRPGKDATVAIDLAHLGAQLAVDSADAIVREPGVDAQITALFFPNASQHVDLVTTVSHDAGDSQSQTLVKSAATGSGQARYLGNIRIAPHAQATESSLRDDALLLSKRAHIDSVPALEIAANDVKAYHGATVGALDEEQIFYMTSRGIPRADAEKMIALGFFEPAIERFPGNALRERLRAALQGKIDS